jgi:uncharacterized protein (TIGR03435 family)
MLKLRKAGGLACVMLAAFTARTATAPQETPAGARPAFEAATVKPAAPNALPNRVMPTAPNRLAIPSMTLSWLIYTAYGDGGFNTAMRVTGGPDWVNRTAFAVEGVAPGKTTLRQRRLMLQTLLEDRFALKVRTEVSMVDMLTLVADRRDGTLGPKMKEWNGACRNGTPTEEDDPAMPRCFSGYRPGGISLDGATLFNVAELLSLPQARSLLGGLVSDQTGLKGRYTMDLDYQFPPDVTGPSLSTVIQEQWGLRVVPGKGSFRLVVVENARMPVDN